MVGLTPGGPRSSSAPPPGVTAQVTPLVTIPLTGDHWQYMSLDILMSPHVRSLSGCPRANKPKSRHKDGAESEPLRWETTANIIDIDINQAGAQYQAVMAQVMPQANFCHIEGEWVIWSLVMSSGFTFQHFAMLMSVSDPSERACPIAAKMAKSLNSSSRSHYSYNQYPYPAMDQTPSEYSGSGCPCPMGICL